MTTPLFLVTGATSGIGKLAAQQLRNERPNCDLIISGPDPARVARITSELQSIKVTGRVSGHAADLKSMKVAGSLAERVAALGRPVTALVLAAGRQTLDDHERTDDGFEATFAVNVLANVALIDALLQKGQAPQRIVLFSSGTHDARKRAGLPVPRHADPFLLAFPERDVSRSGEKQRTRGARAYTASKLAVAMLAYAYAREYPSVQVNALDPQLTPGTSLARAFPPVVRFAWHNVLPALVPVLPFMNTPLAVARAAVALALDSSLQTSGRYMEVRRGRLAEGRSSQLSYDMIAQAKLLKGCRELILGVT